MKRLLLVSAVVAALSVRALPTISDVTVKESGSHDVTVTYTLSGEPAVVTFDVQTNALASGAGAWASIGGENIAPTLAGHVNRYIANTSAVRVITWHPNASWPGYRFDNKTAKVVLTAWPTNAPPLFMVVDLTNAANRITYYPDRRSVPGGITNDMYKTDKIIFRKIPAAGITWQMGSPTTEKHYGAEQMLHQVMLKEDYYMACYETTKGYWDNVNAYYTNAGGTGLYNRGRDPTDNYAAKFSAEEVRMSPLGRVNYGVVRGTASTDSYNWPADGHAVLDYSFFGALRHMTGGSILFDLPTEAQWEFAARAMTSTQTYYGDPYYNDNWSPISSVVNVTLMNQYAWSSLNSQVSTNADGNVVYGCNPVGRKLPNAFDMYDILGNEYECCLDQYAKDLGSDAVVDPKGTEGNPTRRVIRGGQYLSSGWYSMKSSTRTDHTYSDPQWGSIGTGFRIWAPAVAVKP